MKSSACAPGKETDQSPEWRPYLILHKRYVEGLDPHTVASSLYIGDRQLRRDHSRALQALSVRIWDGYFEQAQEEAPKEEGPDFELHPEQLDLNEVIKGVVTLITPRLESEHVHLELELTNTHLDVFIDRILLRQILLSLLNYGLHLRGQSTLWLHTTSGTYPRISLVFEADEQWATIQSEEQDALAFIHALSARLPARVEETYPSLGKSGKTEIRLVFAASHPQTILVIDDQAAALKMYQRYLSRTSFEAVGIADPTQALSMTEQTQPALIILDVMMPHIDGWEVLQALKLNPQTRAIPIIVCSAWGDPNLAHSLGAAAFLKKPVVQKDLLEALAKLGIQPE